MDEETYKSVVAACIGLLGTTLVVVSGVIINKLIGKRRDKQEDEEGFSIKEMLEQHIRDDKESLAEIKADIKGVHRRLDTIITLSGGTSKVRQIPAKGE